MYGYIDGINFGELDAMKYYAPPSTWSDEKKRNTAKEKIFSGDWLGSEKKDGYFAKLIKDEDGTIILYSRSRGVNGKYADKHEWVPQLNSFFDNLPNGTCLLGELYFPNQPGSKRVTTVMGCLKDKAISRQNSGEKLHFYVFDVLAWCNESMINTAAKARFDSLKSIIEFIKDCEYVGVANYYSGTELWELLQAILGRGDEGIVITKGSAIYEPGKRPSKTTLKIKKEISQTIDCFFTGRGSAPTKAYTGKELETWQYWQNTITDEKIIGDYYKEYMKGQPITPITKSYFHGWCGSLEIAVFKHSPGHWVQFGDRKFENVEVFPLGWLSGITEEMKANPKQFAFRPMEVTAMEYDALAHTLRHGKMKGWRDDLSIVDCTLDKVEPEDNMLGMKFDFK